MPGPFATVTVCVPPPGTVVAPIVTVAIPLPLWTVIVALVASRVSVSFEKNLRLYVPGVVGIVNVTVAEVVPVRGAVRVPLRYFQSSIIVSAAVVA